MKTLSPILKAAASGNRKEVARQLKKGAAVDDADASGRTALMWAAAGGHPKTVRLLIAAGADPKKADRRYGITALMLAAHAGHDQVVRVLLESGATDSAWEALLLAQLGNHIDVCKRLTPLVSKEARRKANLRDTSAA